MDPPPPNPLINQIEAARERLKAAYTSEELDAVISCPLQGADDAPPHSGLCCQCSTPDHPISHNISRSAEALEEAELLQLTLEMNYDIGHPEAKTARLQESGSMFGVLVCLNENGEKVVLKAFSGGFDGTNIKIVPDWCPPLDANQDKQNELNNKVYEEKLKREEYVSQAQELNTIIAELANDYEISDAKYANELKRIGQLKLTDDEWKELGYEPAPNPAPKKGSDAYNAVSSKMYTPLSEKRKKDAAYFNQRIENFKQQRYDLNIFLSTSDKDEYGKALAAQRKYMAEERFITNYKNQQASLLQACCPPSNEIATNGQMGACAAQKLLAEARRQGLIPVSLAEFWFGADTSERKHKQFYQSCQYCRSVMGFALCGLIEKQKELYNRLNPDAPLNNNMGSSSGNDAKSDK